MGITNASKQVNTTQIDCSGTVRVTLALAASPDIMSNPTDIVLVLDRSGSMQGTPLTNLKLGAKTFIDIIDEATDGSKDGTIGSGSHIGLVSFATTATTDVPLTTSVQALTDAVDDLNAAGSTNHADAFTKAIEAFDPASTNAKVIVMFTDGKTTIGDPPSPVAAAARAAGIIIYVIGLIGDDGIDIDALNDWATDPDSSHVAVTPDAADLEELFAGLAANISKTGATNIVINDTVNPDFTIVGINTPTIGVITPLTSNTFRWNIDALGVSGNEGASVEFFIRHIGVTSGLKEVNTSVTYSDNEHNVVNFPSPAVLVDCGAVFTEPCPEPVSITVNGCQDSAVFDLGSAFLESLGRIIQLSVTIRNVCPNKRVALGVVLTEVDPSGTEHQRGLKTLTVPAHTGPGCRDVLVRCIKFVLPEDLDVSGGSTTSICDARHFRVRVITHYIDTDFRCCDAVL